MGLDIAMQPSALKPNQGVTVVPGQNGNNSLPGLGPSFGETLKETLDKSASVIGSATTPGAINTGNTQLGNSVKFSNHAIDRMRSRGISFNQEDVSRLNEAVNRAASKGSKDSLILMNDSALIVSVKNKTVVTVMDKTALKENVFTNIDSTIVM